MCRVFDLGRMARDRPDAPAIEVTSEDEFLMLYLELERFGIVCSRPLPCKPPDIRTFVIDLA